MEVVLDVQDRIRQLCTRAIEEDDPAALHLIACELRAALKEHRYAMAQLAQVHLRAFRPEEDLIDPFPPRE